MDLRLSAPSLGFWVAVRLRSFGDRWIAVADIADDLELGTAMTARGALAQALSPLGGEAADSLLDDRQFRLLAASCRQQRRC